MSIKKILIIERDQITSLDLKHQLTKGGFSVNMLTSFVETELYKENYIPDLIIAFSDMKQMEGFENFKTNFAENETPIICIGTISNDETQIVCKELNIIGMFTKPFDSKNLITFTKEYFGSKESKTIH